jgi:HPt (histidine-containing phosphotransfer) domain-containing protein
MPDAPLDPTKLERLHRIGGSDLVRQLLDSFLQEGRARREALARAHAGGDLGTLADAAHTVVAGAGQLGAMQLAAEAREVEQAARRGDAAAARTLTPALLTTFDSALAALTQARETS